MNKGKHGRKLSRTTNERKQLFRNLIRSTVEKGQVTTTLAKAKATQPQLEKLVTMARQTSLTSLRRLIGQTGDVETAKKLTQIGILFQRRPGGYTRIVRLGSQTGDNTEIVRLEWVEKLVVPEVVKTSASPDKSSELKKVSAKPKQTTAKQKGEKNK